MPSHTILWGSCHGGVTVTIGLSLDIVSNGFSDCSLEVGYLIHQENGNFLFGILRHLLILSSALGGFFFIYMSFRKFSKVATSKCKCKSKIERSKKAAKVNVNVKVKLEGVKGR